MPRKKAVRPGAERRHARCLETWRGERGRITPRSSRPCVDDPATLCFVCGPAAMVDEVPRMLMELGVDGSRIRIEEW